MGDRLITERPESLAGFPPSIIRDTAGGVKMEIEEIKEIVSMSGIELFTMGAMDIPFTMDVEDLALMFFTMSREDLSKKDKALILAGILVAPMGE